MKNILMKHFAWIGISSILLLGFISCEKDYILGGDLHDPNVNMTTYDYLKSHPQHLFDTILIIVDAAGMKDVINGDVTFFAPTNYCFNTFCKNMEAYYHETDENLKFNLDSLLDRYSKEELREMMGGYIVQEKLTYDKLTQAGKMYPTMGKDDKKPASRYVSYEEVDQYTVPGVISTKPKYVFYTQIVGDKDVNGKDPSGDDDLNDHRIQVQTSGILTTNGVIHVLQNTHSWTFWTYNP